MLLLLKASQTSRERGWVRGGRERVEIITCNWKHTKSWQSSKFLCIPLPSPWINNSFECRLSLLWLTFFCFGIFHGVLMGKAAEEGVQQQNARIEWHRWKQNCFVFYVRRERRRNEQADIKKRREREKKRRMNEYIRISMRNEHQLTTYWHRQPHELHWKPWYNKIFFRDATKLAADHLKEKPEGFHWPRRRCDCSGTAYKRLFVPAPTLHRIRGDWKICKHKQKSWANFQE